MSLGDTRCIVVCVDFWDFLKISLEWNQQHFSSTLVVSHPNDHRTIEVAQSAGVNLFLTRVFYESGAVFNKFAALELGLDYMGRDGWIAIIDADTLLPRDMNAWTKRPGCLYCPRRRILPFVPQSVSDVPVERRWRQLKYQLPPEPSGGGYCRIFHASDPVLGPAPWHKTTSTWCDGPDTMFQNKWIERNKVRTPFEVLHLGQSARDWAGRVTPFADGTIPEDADKHRDTMGVLLRARREKGQKIGRYEREEIHREDVPTGAV